ncbi:uncharacterized protein LOC110111254 [Dendrobium catenatum]|uniref:uncharacterized protein LOC110111254 n=1 Tax=Dendrobium catenatum TaxID=906689 RepID=UPI0009F2A4DD|nr:uncharacterized protein LOC110111254 [Dendrobium catenatum]
MARWLGTKLGWLPKAFIKNLGWTSMKLSAHQLDVSNAFLHGKLTETVFMAQPPGFTDPNYPTHGTHLFLLIYVDDILLMGNNASIQQQLLDDLQGTFQLKHLGNLHNFLGLQFTSVHSGYLVQQTSYTNTILQRAGMVNCKPLLTPMTSKVVDNSDDEFPFTDPPLYRRLVGSLQKVALGLPITAGSLNLTAFTDADWAGDKTDRKSTTGFCVFIGSTLVFWATKKQSTIARSSTEAEYRALTSLATELIWLRRLLKEFHVEHSSPVPIFCDNISAISLAHNPVFHARTKHIEIDHHFIRECVNNGTVVIHHVSTNDQIADIFTKPLSTSKFCDFRHKLTLQNL